MELDRNSWFTQGAVQIERADLDAFYRTAALALRQLDSHEKRARRFGADADAAWRTFSRDLTEGDRLDLLVREAAARFAEAAAPRVIFQLDGLTDDEPFGPTWAGPPNGLASTLLREAAGLPVALDAVLAAAASAWSLRPIPLARTVTDAIAPASRIVVAGAGAIVSVARAFAAGSGLDLSDQVVFVCDAPAERQLAGLAALVLDAPRAIRLVTTAGADATALRAAGFKSADLVAISDDAAPATRDAAPALARTLGA